MHSTEKTFTSHDSTIHYWDYNSDQKKTILVVHGFRGTHHGLEYIVKEMSDFRFIIPDLPGFGASDPLTDTSHTIETYTECVYNLIQSLDKKPDYILGHSMGTIIAARLVSLHPTIVKKAVFINPISASPSKGLGIVKIFPGYVYHYAAGKYLPEKIGMWILSNKYLFLLGSATMTKTKDKALRKMIHWNHMEYMKRFGGRKSLLEAFESSNKSTIADYKDNLVLPMLFVAGQKDDIASIKSQRALVAQLDSAELVELTNVGHIVHYEKPKEAAAAIRAFLKK